MKPKTLTLCCATLLLVSGCASTEQPTIFYQYKDGNPNFDAVKYECLAEATAAIPKIDCSSFCPGSGVYGVQNCFDCHRRATEPSEEVVRGCISRKGWLPCPKDNQGRQQCPRN